MTGLVEFLRARADEDEAEARAMIEGAPPGYGKASGGALRNPHRVLAEVDAKRRIVDHAERWAQTLHATPEGWTDEGCTVYRMAMEWTLRNLATPHADHPDYQQEWQP